MIGFMEIKLVPENKIPSELHCGLEAGMIDLPEGFFIEDQDKLLFVGEDEVYMHCFTLTGAYYGIYKNSFDKNHIYSYILELNNK